jgi:NAD(P) transhydrogenase subunit alpha
MRWGLSLAFAAALTFGAATLSAGAAPAVPADDGQPAVATHTAETNDAEVAAADSWSMLFVFVLSTFIGMGVIGRVSRLLHTPLMSLTNAISAIAIVGSIMVAGSDYPEPIRILGAIAVFASMANIVSGFLITDRMLKMFRQVRSPVPATNNAPSSSPPTGPHSK